MTNKFLEQFYENVILPRYGEAISFGNNHGKVGIDAWAHYFKSNGKEYVLVYEGFPGNTDFDDGLSHEVVKCVMKRALSCALVMTPSRCRILLVG